MRELTIAEMDYVAGAALSGMPTLQIGAAGDVTFEYTNGSVTFNPDGTESVVVDGNTSYGGYSDTTVTVDGTVDTGSVTNEGINWTQVASDLAVGSAVAVTLLTAEITVPIAIALTAGAIGAQIVNWQAEKSGAGGSGINAP